MAMSISSQVVIATCLLAILCKGGTDGGVTEVVNRSTSINDNIASDSVVTEGYYHTNLESISCDSNCTSSWVYSIDGHYHCGSGPKSALRCSSDQEVALLPCNCVTYNTVDGVLEVGKCLYTCGREDDSDDKNIEDHVFLHIPSELSKMDQFLCSEHFNRTGTLCGQCQDGLYPLAYSFDMNCVSCQNGTTDWWEYVLVAYFPLTVFYIVILFFNVNVTSSLLTGFVNCCQTVALPVVLRPLIISSKFVHLQGIVRYTSLFYSIWNLDFFRSLNLNICLGTDTLQTLSLDLAVGIYPLLLIIITYSLIHIYDRKFRLLVIFWRPFRKVLRLLHSNWEIRTSLIDAFATFFFLSNVKFLSVTFDLLVPVEVYQLNSKGHFTKSWRLYYDASIPYFGEKHLPYAILAIFTLIIFVLLPILLLVIYPFFWFQKVINSLPFHRYVLHTFVDAFYGCYKDGTEPNTRDCRLFASAFFLCRLFLLLISSVILNIMYYPIALFVITIYTSVQVMMQPFKENTGNLSEVSTAFMLLLALWHASLLAWDMSTRKVTMKSIQLLCIGFSALVNAVLLLFLCFLILHWMYNHRKFGAKLIKQFHAWRNGYELLE